MPVFTPPTRSAAVEQTYSGETPVPSQCNRWKVPSWARSFRVDCTTVSVVSLDPNTGWMPVFGTVMILPLLTGFGLEKRGVFDREQRPVYVYADAGEQTSIMFSTEEVASPVIWQDQESVGLVLAAAEQTYQGSTSPVIVNVLGQPVVAAALGPAAGVAPPNVLATGYFEQSNPLLLLDGGIGAALPVVQHRGVKGARFGFQFKPHANSVAFTGGAAPGVRLILEVGTDQGGYSGGSAPTYSPTFVSFGYVEITELAGLPDGGVGSATIGFDFDAPSAFAGLTFYGAGGSLPTMFRLSAVVINTEAGAAGVQTWDLAIWRDWYRVP